MAYSKRPRHLKPRRWQVRKPARENEAESLGSADLEKLIKKLAAETGLSTVTTRVCVLRGHASAESIQRYLSPKLTHLKDPFSIKDMTEAVDRLVLVKKNGQRIRVFSDYDVDGTSGGALLGWIFRDLELEHDIRQPDRFKDGYGLSVQAVEEAKEAGVDVLVTVDCGITSFDAADRAKELGIDFIILDHHQIDPVRLLPVATAVVNPQRSDCESGLKELCGCGVAFYLSMALRTRGRAEGWFEKRPEPNLKQHLDLVVLATAADMVPLVGDNRILVRHGMEVIRRTSKPGLRALMEGAGLSKKSFGPGNLGYTLGPRINASGRMGSASLAMSLLTTQDPLDAITKAGELEKINRERAELQNQIWDDVRKKVETGIKAGRFKHAVVVGDQGWHEGVVGIVASRVTESFRLPAIVISLNDELGKGSVRSYGGVNVLEALRKCSNLLKTFGGHKMAAGLSLEPAQFEAFAEQFDREVGSLDLEEKVADPPLMLESELDVADLDLKTLHELEALGPFGPGNPEPVFALEATMSGRKVLKDRHLKMNLLCEKDGNRIEAIWFNAAENRDLMARVNERGRAHQWAAVPELNRFRGQTTPNLRIRDWRVKPDGDVLL